MTVMPDMFDYDAELRPHNELLRAAARVGRRDQVLDIGCGTGQTTREAARAADAGSVVGVDVSTPMLERARELSAGQGLTNITYLRADAQIHPFPPTSFDLGISRFGTMFFADPVAAFTNIGQALRPAARARSHSPTRPSRRTSWRRPASRTSASPTCTSPCTTARTAPPPSTTCTAC